jgi:putative hemolysin
MLTVIGYLAGLLLALLLSGLFSGAETGVYCIDRVRLRVAGERGEPAARRLEQLLRRPEDLVITMLLGTNVADYLVTAFTAALLLHLAVSPSFAEVYATAIVTPLILVFGGMVPKDAFRRQANELMGVLSLPLVWCYRVASATGLVTVLRGITHTLLRWIDPTQAGGPASVLPRARTLALLREGAARGGLSAVQRDLIERVLNLSTVRVRDVMIPRARAATIPRRISRDDFLRIARMAHFSRLLVYEDDPGRIVGVINVYDVLSDADARPVAEHVRTPLTLPMNMSASAALLRLQRGRDTLAVVQDDQGHFVGLLTVKDLVEEIVGDIEVW